MKSYNPEGAGCRKYSDALVAEVMKTHREKGHGAKMLSKSYGIPYPTIDNWLAGDCRQNNLQSGLDE